MCAVLVVEMYALGAWVLLVRECRVCLVMSGVCGRPEALVISAEPEGMFGSGQGRGGRAAHHFSGRQKTLLKRESTQLT